MAPRRVNGSSGTPTATSKSSRTEDDSGGDDPPDDESGEARLDNLRRWIGYCLSCHQPGLELETRFDLGARVLCDECAEGQRPTQLTLEQVRP